VVGCKQEKAFESEAVSMRVSEQLIKQTMYRSHTLGAAISIKRDRAVTIRYKFASGSDSHQRCPFGPFTPPYFAINLPRMTSMVLWFLVIAQFALAALLVLSAPWSADSWTAWLCGMPGVGLAVWAWLTMGLRQIRVHPSPVETTRLITSGPYAIVRHPMYTGLLWFTAALLPLGFTGWRLIAWFTLVGVLVAKLSFEEREMAKRFPGYIEYQERVSRLIPYVW
tara:strand:- start:145085 stop:145756 length:672 start_codon:yes stop_codon:yes gene_type:complete